MTAPLKGAATTLPFSPQALDATVFTELRLLVIQPSSSRNVTLPANGHFIIGRAPDCEIPADDPSVSRKHARIVVKDGEARVMDLDSRNGVRVNGVVVRGAHMLSSGDVIGIGDVTLVVRPNERSRRQRALLRAGETIARLDHEVERALGYARPLSLLVVEDSALPAEAFSALDQSLRPLDLIGRTTSGEWAIVLPELDAAEARAAGSLVVEAVGKLPGKGVRAGLATCPADGCDAETLLAAARAAARAGNPGEIAGPGERTSTLRLGERVVIVADPAVQRIFALIERLAAAELPVLITGETGTGKEHAAYAVHHGSRRAEGPFIALNCAAIPETLWESELFGFEKGAFSGALSAKAGLFERAHGGTLFLDEIGELSLPAQAKFLRVLETGTFARVGEAKERRADVRIVAATNRALDAEVAAHRFREDLYYRLATATVVLPPLRERPVEIPILARHFLETARRRNGQSPLSIAPDALRALAEHQWPGNVRELKNVMELCAATVPFGALERWHLPEAVGGCAPTEESLPAPASAPSFRPLAEELEELEKRRIREALAATGGVKIHAARLIGMPERTFRLKLRQYGLS